MGPRNYQRELDCIISSLTKKPTLLLHVCCAPCASYVLEYLQPYFEITAFYYNPNIQPLEEYQKRLREVRRLCNDIMRVPLLEGEYEQQVYSTTVRGLEQEPEGGKRCTGCIRLRLQKTAELADSQQYDYFASSLSISPHKNAVLINTLGEELQRSSRWLPNDFKKRGGYLRSIALCKQYNIYRQQYCGCLFGAKTE